eukprot:6035813-Pleurochrysis_carterae.AAC.1
MAASFPANLAMLRCVGKLGRALGSALCYMLKRQAYACKLALTRWRAAFKMRSRSAWTSPSTHPGRG